MYLALNQFILYYEYFTCIIWNYALNLKFRQKNSGFNMYLNPPLIFLLFVQLWIKMLTCL